MVQKKASGRGQRSFYCAHRTNNKTERKDEGVSTASLLGLASLSFPIAFPLHTLTSRPASKDGATGGQRTGYFFLSIKKKKGSGAASEVTPSTRHRVPAASLRPQKSTSCFQSRPLLTSDGRDNLINHSAALMN